MNEEELKKFIENGLPVFYGEDPYNFIDHECECKTLICNCKIKENEYQESKEKQRETTKTRG